MDETTIWLSLLVYLAPWILVPAIALAFIPRAFRLTILVLGLIFGFGISSVMDLGGPDSPGLLYPFYGMAIALGALLAEGLALVISRVRRPTSKR